MKCPKCEGHLREELIEGRKRQSCAKCSYLHYDKREGLGGFQVVSDEIADEVARVGSFRFPVASLLNTCFRAEPGKKPFQQQLRDWSYSHGFGYSMFQEKDAHGKDVQWIRFFRAPFQE